MATIKVEVGQTPIFAAEPPMDNTLATMVEKAWQARWNRLALTKEEKMEYDINAGGDLEKFVKKLESSCREHYAESTLFRSFKWFEPLFKAVELYSGPASIYVQAHPNPASLVLGSIVVAMQVSSRILDYQRRTIQALSRMGSKAENLLSYEREVYENDHEVQIALIDVHFDIISFCRKAVRIMDERIKRGTKIKKMVMLNLVSDFDSRLGKELGEFEIHMEQLEMKALMCDRKRVKQMAETTESMNKQLTRLVADTDKHFQNEREFREQSLIHFRHQEDLAKREQEQLNHIERKQKEAENNMRLKWLSKLSFSEEYFQRCKTHLKDTGLWLTESSEYQNWKFGPRSDLLWVRGKPGCGKSMLSAIAITDLEGQREQDIAFAFALCQSKLSHNASAILGALAKQLCQQQSEPNSVLHTRFTTSQNGENPETRSCRSIINAALPCFAKVFLVIDGLDECTDNDQLVEELLSLISDDLTSTIKIIVFSRPDYNLQKRLSAYKQLHPDRGNNTKDLEAYILYKFSDEGNKSVNEDIQRECLAKADGMFLWVELLDKMLRKQPLTKKQKQKIIHEIPSGLRSLYDQIMENICRQYSAVKSTAFLVLRWVTHALVPLNQSMMLEAVADYLEVESLEEVAETSRLTDAEELVAICSNLVFIDSDGFFKFCHGSVLDYLEGDAQEQDAREPSPHLKEYLKGESHAHAQLAEICLRYLLLKDFEDGPVPTMEDLVSLVEKAPFIEYAATYWSSHANRKDSPPQLMELIQRLAYSQGNRELAMEIRKSKSSETNEVWYYPGSSNVLHFAALYRLFEFAKLLPGVQHLSVKSDGSGATPFRDALYSGNHEMSLWLLQMAQKTDPQSIRPFEKLLGVHVAASYGWVEILEALLCDAPSLVDEFEDGATPLIRACALGSGAAVKVLIEHGACVDKKDDDGFPPLNVAVHFGYSDIVNSLLKAGANPNCSDPQDNTPLHIAAEKNYISLAETLLDRGANGLAVATALSKETALHCAAAYQAIDAVELLLRRLPDLINIETEESNSALHIAAQKNLSKVAQALLSGGILKDAVNNNGHSALYIAASKGAVETVKVLVEGGCNVTTTNVNGRTVVHAAALGTKSAVLKEILLSQPPESRLSLVNQPDKGGETPLHYSINGGNLTIVELLLEHGAEATKSGQFKASPLHYAASFGQKAISRALLEHTKQPNLRDKDDETPLHYAMKAGRLKFIKRFLEDCDDLGLVVELGALNRYRQTAFSIALYKSYEDLALILMRSMGENLVSVPDMHQNYPIHYAAWHGYDSIVKVLLNHDGKNIKGYLGQTPFHYAALRGHLKTLKLFGTPAPKILNEQDDFGDTPIMKALDMGHSAVVDYLLTFQTDYSFKNDHGDSLMHVAAETGNLSLLEHLLRLGYLPEANIDGDTPLHMAVKNGHVDIVDAFIRKGFNHCNLPNHFGSDCSFLAAESGDLDMIIKLKEHGAQFKSRNFRDRTAIHCAAERGHLDIITFLESQGADLSHRDIAGQSALLMAATQGYPLVVDYLLESQQSAVNDFRVLDRISPAIAAARLGFLETVRRLVEAGADLRHRNVFGLNALNYLLPHILLKPEYSKLISFEYPEFKKFEYSGSIYFGLSENSDAQRQIRCQYVATCCKDIISIASDGSKVPWALRLDLLSQLWMALLLLGDYDAAKVCGMDLLWPAKNPRHTAGWQCDLCKVRTPSGTKHVCMSCLNYTFLCNSCHEDYQEAGQKPPEALQVVKPLEDVISSLRLLAHGDISLFNVFRALDYFVAGRKWWQDALEKYDEWELKYNSGNKYKTLPRPGQEFLKLIKAFSQERQSLLLQFTEMSDEVVLDTAIEDIADRLKDLESKFKHIKRKYRADKEKEEFICRDHEYLAMTDEERERIMAEGVDLDHKNGTVTIGFLETLLARYTPIPSTRDSSPIRDGQKKTRMDSEVGAGETARALPQGLQRSLTAIYEDKNKQDEASQLKSREGEPIGHVRRAQTLPVTCEDFRSLKHREGNLDAPVASTVASLKAQLGSSNESEAAVIPVQVCPQASNAENHLAEGSDLPNLSPAANKSSEKEPNMTLIPSPDIDAISTEADVTGLLDSNDSSLADEREGKNIVLEEIRKQYKIYNFDDMYDDDQEVLAWFLGEKCIEIMIPGSVEAYRRERLRFRKQAEKSVSDTKEEEQDVMEEEDEE